VPTRISTPASAGAVVEPATPAASSKTGSHFMRSTPCLQSSRLPQTIKSVRSPGTGWDISVPPSGTGPEDGGHGVDTDVELATHVAAGKRRSVIDVEAPTAVGNMAEEGKERDTSAAADPTAAPHAPAQESRSLRAGAVIGGRYQVSRLIAAGAMSRVYLARQLNIHRPVAVKVVSRDLARERETMVRFRREARALADVQHPGIVSVYDIGTTATGEPYIVMEYVEGSSLAATIKERGRLPVAEAARIMLQVADALAVVHSVGVIHRDLKPSNMLLGTTRGGAPQLKIVDFGLAKVIHERGEEFLTKIGTVLGTPEYMAPEQIRSGTIDGRADIYSLGCVAYEMLAGKPPFVGAEMSTLYRQLHEKVPSLTEAAPGSAVPPPFERLVRRMLAKEPGDRPASAADLRNEILAACAEAGIDRAALGLTDSIHESSWALPPPPRGALGRLLRIEVLLLALVVAVGSVAAGVALERFRRPAGDGAAAAAPPASPGAIPPASAGKARLVIRSDPPGTDCRVDGGEPTTTPAVVELAPGSHRVSCDRDGFVASDGTVELTGGATEVTRLTLNRSTYEVTIATVPPGAVVAVDGTAVGPSPATATVTEGEFHEVTATLGGFQQVSYYLLGAVPERALSFRLRPALLRYGTLYIDATGMERVIIDGEETGLRTPTGEIQLSPGKHEISLVSGAGARQTRSVTIRHNEPAVLDFK